MKKLLALLLLSISLSSLTAAEFATISIKMPDEKKPKTVIIELFPEAAPQTVANFEKLAKKNFYKGIAFHRALSNRLVQVGDPQSKKNKSDIAVGTAGPGYVIPAEISLKHVRGAVAMGRLPNKINPNKVSNGSQFFVCLAPAPQLNGEYTVFGNVTQGIEVLEEISRSDTDSNDTPIKRFVIRSVKISRQ